MIKKYEKPTAVVIPSVSEGVYVSSGSIRNDGMRIIPCDVFQFRPGIWRYDIWFDHLNHVPDTGLDLYINFNVPVTLNWCDDQKKVSGEGTTTLVLHFNKEDAMDPSRDRGLEVKTPIEPVLKSFHYSY